MAYHYENNELTDICAMLLEYSCGVQRVRKAISAKKKHQAAMATNFGFLNSTHTFFV
jgi:hypothetical protein